MSLIKYPIKLVQRLARLINNNARTKRLLRTPAEKLEIGTLNTLELMELIKKDSEAKIIYDVGANVGSWTLLAKSFFPNAQLYAFEPIVKHIERFKHDTIGLTNVVLHSFCLGNDDCEQIINISSYSDSSSLLSSTSLEFEEFKIKKESEQIVKVKKGSTLIEAHIVPVPDVIKLDVQGYELEVLKGFGKYLNHTNYVIVEVAFKEYYVGQPLFLDIANYLYNYNLHLVALGNSTPVGKELGQIDVLFKRKS